MLFPDFTGVRSLDWLFFVARLGGKKYRSEARALKKMLKFASAL